MGYRGKLFPLLLLLSLLPLSRADDCTGQPCDVCQHRYRHGDVCDSDRTVALLQCDPETRIMRQSDTAFLQCVGNTFVMRECARGTYFEPGKGCLDPTMQPFMQAAVSGSGRVGDICSFNTDCLNGMYCSGGICACLSTYILREGYCYEKINPNQPGCTYDVQCEAVWPGAKCQLDSAVGTCRCPGSHVARETRDGWVCVSLKDSSAPAGTALHFVCPLPEGAGFKTALSDPDPQRDSLPVGCTVGSSIQMEPVLGLQGGAACIWPSTGEFIGDIYDCVHTSPHVTLTTQFPQAQYASTADGVCCPSRALACTMPQATGPNPTEPRWWYNAVTGTCQQFMWDPSASEAAAHTANNFRTIQHCESYCRDTCQRGSPQYSSEPMQHNERPLTTCASGSSGCMNDHACTAVGSQHFCCPTPALVCGVRGGRAHDHHPRSTPYHAGFMVASGRETIRFYYDAQLGRCADFVYRGAGGNFNNFLSKNECDMYCARLQCERGSPLRIGEDAQRCQSNSHCPSSHECRLDQSVCCPRKQTICAQPMRAGDCTESVKRYWYNARTRQCQMFEYTGCQGNDNNFGTILDCQNFCKNVAPEPRCMQGQAYRDSNGNYISCSNGQGCPQNHECYFDGAQWGCCPTKSYTCSLNADAGVQCGSGSTFRYFYNPATQSCDSFSYSGCDGNSNNFASRDSCEQYCAVGGCPYGGTPLRDHSGQMKVCHSASSCPESHECTTVQIGSSTVHRCCPTRGYMCSLPPLTGNQCGAQPVQRFYFNIVTGQCTGFQYGGCDGNQNNFVSVQQCRSFCYSNACPAGNVAYVDQNSQQPIMCNEALSNSCPPGYACTYNALINSHVCCGATDQGVCPEGEKAFIDALTVSAKECAIHIDASCPSDYLCRFNMNRNKYYCCASKEGLTCPVGKFLHRDSRTGQQQRCTMGKNDQCPEGYSCQSYLKNAFQGFCCTSNSVCPDDAEYHVDDTTKQPRACTMGSFVSCPAGFTCRSHLPGEQEGFCCKGGNAITEPVTDGCPPLLFLHSPSCDPFNPANQPCPSASTCQWSTANQRYQCCGANAPASPQHHNDGCPNQQVAFREGGSAKVCTAGGKSACPTGYFCQFSSTNGQFQCCGVSGGCPSSSVAFVGLSGVPELCALGQSQCPDGFTCSRALSGQHVCCSVLMITCEEDEVLVDSSCRRRASPGEPCQSSEQCVGGSVCKSNECRCPEGTQRAGQFCTEIITCKSDEIQVNGQCLKKAAADEDCTSSAQCPVDSYCTDLRCQCRKGTVNKGGKCVQQSVKKNSGTTTTALPKLSSSCSSPASSPWRDPDTHRPQYCSPHNEKTRCRHGYECQINDKRTQYMCCSISTTSAPESRPTSIASAISQIEEEIKEESQSVIPIPRRSKKPKTDGATPGVEVCQSPRTPYLINGLPKKCTNGRCPAGYDCVYKRREREYYCCSNSLATGTGSAKGSVSSGGRGMPPHYPSLPQSALGGNPRQMCPRGVRPLLYPNTKAPIACSPIRQSCPQGYRCQPAVGQWAFVCCPLQYLDLPGIKKAPCPGAKVQVTRINGDGDIVKRCEHSCPRKQIPVEGVCYSMSADKPLPNDDETPRNATGKP